MQENHYKYFKELYDEEGTRASDLHDNAKVNTTIVSLYAAFIGIGLAPNNTFFVAFSKMVSVRAIAEYFFFLALIFLFISIILSLYTTRISEYQVPNYPRDVLRVLSSYKSDSDFYEDRVIDLVAAYKWNSNINDQKVDWLYFARLFLLLGVAAHFCFYMLTFMKF